MALQIEVDVAVPLMMPTTAQIQAELGRAMQRAVDAVAARARANLSGRFLRVRTGRGVRSVRTRVRITPHEVIGTVGSRLFYLRILHQGFPGQQLTVRRGKKGFTFFGGHGLVQVPTIQHPGITARPWLQNAVEESGDDIRQSFADAVLNIGRFLSRRPAASPHARTA